MDFGDTEVELLSETDRDRCEDAMIGADQNKDNRIDASEYVDFVILLSRFPSCPDVGMVSLFLSGGIFEIAFSNLTCLCERYEISPTTCCADENKAFFIGAATAGSYTLSLRDGLPMCLTVCLSECLAVCSREC